MMNRRQFLRRLSAAGGLLALGPLAACVRPPEPAPEAAATPPPAATPTDAPEPATASPTPTEAPARAAPTATPPPTEAPDAAPTATAAATAAPSPMPEEVQMAQVALIKTTDRAEGVRRAVALLGVNPVQGRSVFLKPNFNSADPAPGSTHPDVLRALVGQLREMGAADITLADRSGMGNTRNVMQRLGVFEQADELGYDAIVLDELESDDWTLIETPDDHWSQGFPVPRMMLDAGALVNACCLKTHRFGGHFTLALKNSVGYVAKRIGAGHDYMGELHGSAHMRTMIAEINAARLPDLIVLDGVTAFTHGGPDRGTIADTEVMLAGTDPVAMDAIGVAILRLFGTTDEVSRGAVFEQEQIARAAEMGLGVAGPEQIELLTEDADGEAMAAEIMALL